MSLPVYIGDELSAAGYRLAGLDRVICGADEARLRFADALAGDAPLILLSLTVAHAVGATALADAMAKGAPPVMVVPDIVSLDEYSDHRDSVLQRLGLGQERVNA